MDTIISYFDVLAGNKDFTSFDKMIMTTEEINSVCVNVTTNYNCDSDPLSIDKRFNATVSSRDPAVVIIVGRATALITIRRSKG